jgi:HPt (histidine-containing phosphotransfer) domain-containing protein
VNRLAVALVEDEAQVQDLHALRGTLATAGAAAREQVAVDFLEDDLREAEAALAALRDYVAAVGSALRDARAGRRALTSLARDERPLEKLDELQATVLGARRRLAQVASRLPP